MSSTPVPSRAWRFYWALTGHPKSVLFAGLAIACGLGAFLPQLKRDFRAEAYLPDDHPAVVERRRAEEIFGVIADPVVLLVVNEGSTGIFNPHSLQLVRDLAGSMAQIPGIDPERITSLANAKNIVGDTEGMTVKPFYDDVQTQPEADAVRQAVMDSDLLPGRLVARDGRAALVVAEMLRDADGGTVYRAVMDLVGTLKLGEEKVHVAGTGAMSAAISGYIEADRRRMTPLATVLLGTVLLLCYRTWLGLFVPLLLGLGATVITLGSMAVAGRPATVITNTIPVILIALAVADAIHILGHYYEQCRLRPEDTCRERVTSAMADVWRPVTIASLTTITGFAVLSASSWMPPMIAFGLFAALGVTVKLLLALLVLPAALVAFHAGPSAAFRVAAVQQQEGGTDTFARAMGRFGSFVMHRPWPVIGLAFAASIAAVIGAMRVTVNDVTINYFREDEPIHLAEHAINRIMDGAYTLEIVFEVEQQDGLLEPENLARIEAMQREIETVAYVKSSTSIVDYLKRMNRAMNENRPQEYRLPQTTDLMAQYLLLYSASADPQDLQGLIDGDRRMARVRFNYERAADWREVLEGAAGRLASLESSGLRARIVGRTPIYYHWLQEVGRFNALSTVLALLLVWMTAALSFRSLAAATLASIPVAMGVLLVYGFMGFAGVAIGVGTSMFSAIALSIGDDFAMHTVDRLLVLMRTERRSLSDAMPRLFHTTGRELLFSSAAVLLGLGVLVTSRAPSLVSFGAMVIVAVTAGALFSLTVLPALVQVLQPRAFGFGSPYPPGVKAGTVAATSLVLLLVLPGAAMTQPAGLPTGDDVAARANARDDGRFFSAQVTFELTDRGGKTRVNETRVVRKYMDREKRTVIFYVSPANVKGTSFLSIDYPEPGRQDDQWLYLPAARKTRRISAADRGDYFFGTDLTYEDVKLGSKISMEDYRRETVAAEEVDGARCYVVEATAIDDATAKNLGYSHERLWIDAQIWIPRRIEYWDVAGNPLKSVSFKDVRQVQGIWTVHQVEAQNLKTGHQTRLISKNVDYAAEPRDDLFTEQALPRGVQEPVQ